MGTPAVLRATGTGRHPPDTTSDWLVLSGDGRLHLSAAPAALERGLLLVEVGSGLSGATVALHAGGAGETALSVLIDPETGIGLMHRSGGRLLRHVLPGFLRPTGPSLVLTFEWDVADNHWSLAATAADGSCIARTTGQDAWPVAAETVAALRQAAIGSHHPALDWFGLCRRRDAVGDGLAGLMVGLGTLLQTDRGPVPAATIRPGARLPALDGGMAEVIAADIIDLPQRGSIGPYRLRAGHFGASRDMIVGPRTLLCCTGEGVEDLFGADNVLVAVRDLADDRAVLRQEGPGCIRMSVLKLDRPAAISAGGTALHPPSLCPGRARLLTPFETAALMSSQRRKVAFGN
ncbi:MAG: Hint domain-containing protein [Gemmobacter sp.]